MTKLVYRTITACLLCSAFLSGFAQEKDSYLFFCPDNNFKPFGYFLTLGGSHSISRTSNEVLDFEISETTAYRATLESGAKLGPSVELGAFVIPRKGFFRLIDLGIGYRNFSGTETVTATRQPRGDLSYPEVIEQEGTFDYSRVSMRLNLQSVTLLGRKSYFHQGPGFFLDWTAKKEAAYRVPHLELGTSAPEQAIITSLNYTAGLAFKLAPGKLLDIYAHLPLISTGGQIDGAWEKIYSSTYRNYIFGIRYQWLKATPSRVCPAFYGGSNKGKKVASSQPRFSLW